MNSLYITLYSLFPFVINLVIYVFWMSLVMCGCLYFYSNATVRDDSYFVGVCRCMDCVDGFMFMFTLAIFHIFTWYCLPLFYKHSCISVDVISILHCIWICQAFYWLSWILSFNCLSYWTMCSVHLSLFSGIFFHKYHVYWVFFSSWQWSSYWPTFETCQYCLLFLVLCAAYAQIAVWTH